MSSLQHIAISASAGSGKTYQLTNRFIYLLHLTEQPERIIALTFTRTAAGEFFNKIIEKLSEAAADSTVATRRSDELGIEADSTRYHQLLRLLVDRMHQLNLQTLDSFFFRVVSAFALELGLSGNLNLLDETSEPRIRNQVRDSIVHRPGELNEELHEFWQAFKQATYGHEARKVESTVAKFIEQLYGLYLDAPDPALWGQVDRIWPNGCPWQLHAHPDWEKLANALRANIPEGLNKSQQNDFENAAQKIANYPIDEDLNTLLNNALAAAGDIFAGSASIKVRKEITLPAATCRALADILQAVVWHHLQRALHNTQGVHRILDAYHENYDRLVRRPGRLAFADLTHLLSPETAGSPMGAQDPLLRELMDFRLDGQFDHWLFDEFQDTSRPQWAVVRNLIDEILQDSSGQRSLFYVGDTKQCLYLWRNSDDRLFHEIRGHYENIVDRQLAESWRSAPAILDAVNIVFNDNALIAQYFSQDAAHRWDQAWKPHTASSDTCDRSGYACWLEAGKKDHPNRNDRILETLQMLNPIERGMSVGVLVRRNSDANEVADFIRENSPFPVHTGSAVKPAEDNAAGAALLAMLRHAAHPDDALAAGYLKLIDASTPGDCLLAQTDELRDRLFHGSHEEAVKWAAGRIAAHLPDPDRRHRERLQQLIEKAARFDDEELRDPDALYHFLKDSSSGECAPGDAIIVETIHKSKGLEYDVVILVNEDKGSGPRERKISALLDSQGEAEWILEPIKKDLMAADPELERLQAQMESQNDFGTLCTLYVGMTRAKRALYMISDFDRVGKNSCVAYLRECLGDTADENGVVWSTGDPAWHEAFKAPEPPAAAPAEETTPANYAPAHPRLQLNRPSSPKSSAIQASHLLNTQSDAAEFGTRMHDAFEQIEWLVDSSEPLPDILADALATPEIRALFTKPSGKIELWREKAFSYVDGRQFYNGVFDRVHLEKDDAGQYTKATIIDFKTDRIHEGNTLEAATEKHRPQLEAYRHALSKIAQIPPDQIQLVLVFTDANKRVQLAD